MLWDPGGPLAVWGVGQEWGFPQEQGDPSPCGCGVAFRVPSGCREVVVALWGAELNFGVSRRCSKAVVSPCVVG